MIRLIGLIVILIFTTSYTKPQLEIQPSYIDKIEEIKNNLDAAKQDLDEAKLIISDPKRLKRIKRKIKNR